MACESERRKLTWIDSVIVVLGVLFFGFMYYSWGVKNQKEEYKKEVSFSEIRETKERIVNLQRELVEIRTKLENQKKIERDETK